MSVLTILLHVADGLLQSVQSNESATVLIFDEDTLRERGIQDSERDAIYITLCTEHQLSKQPITIPCSTKKPS